MLGKKLITAAAGSAAGGGGVLGVEDVFSTWLYTGNGGTQTITNGIDLAGEGGLVWIKARAGADGTDPHNLFDTNRGAQWRLFSNITNAQDLGTTTLTAFNSDGFALGSQSNVNGSSTTYASWTFRKAEKFFDVVTWTGDGVGTKTVTHSLNAVPGVIIVKKTSGGTGSDWRVYHKDVVNQGALNLTDSFLYGGITSVSASSFGVSGTGDTKNGFNYPGYTYVAYLFAHDAGGFGDDGTESVIKCGSYTGNGSTSGPTIDLGWEPQWVLIKNTNSSSYNWELVDVMRGMTHTGHSRLSPNTSNAEVTDTSAIAPLATGFQIRDSGGNFNQSGSTFIYIAIRRGPMKTPTDATTVFTTSSGLNAAAGGLAFNSGFPVDFFIEGWTSQSYTGTALSRITGDYRYLLTSSTNAEANDGGIRAFDSNVGIIFDISFNMSQEYAWLFRRAPGFFDVVAYTGDGSTSRIVYHNLGVVPEMIILKSRGGPNGAAGTNWGVWTESLGGANKNLWLNHDFKVYTNFIDINSRTSTSFIDSNANWNVLTELYIAYLFATCPGVSKVGSYTGTGTTKDIDCGFAACARFVLIKRTDSTGDWYVWDSARGIISGNDPYFLLNSTATQVTSTDYIDPLSSGFQISSTAPVAINADGGSYIFLAIA